MLLLEIHVDYFRNMISLIRKSIMKASKQIYTKLENRNERFHAWHRNCINMFDELVKLIMRNSDTPERKELENKVKKSYVCIYGK